MALRSDSKVSILPVIPHIVGGQRRDASERHADVYDPATGVPKPADGLPVYEGLRPDFTWPPAR